MPAHPNITPSSMERPRAALAAARRYRAEWLLSMNAGLLGIADLVEAARTEQGRPLRRLTVYELFRTSPDWSKRKADLALETLRRLAAVPADLPSRKLTVGWLVDPRSDGRRVSILADVLLSGQGRRLPPSDRFPYSPVAVTPSRRFSPAPANRADVQDMDITAQAGTE